MHSKSILLVIFIFSLCINTSRGQTEEKIEQIPESKLTHSLGEMGIPNGLSEVAESYKFDHSVKLEATTFDKKGKETESTLLDMYYSDGSTQFGMTMSISSAAMTHIVYDYENGQMVTMTSAAGQKVGMSTTFDPEQIMKSKNIDTAGSVRFEKTGNSKTISGYSCQEYVILREGGSESGDQQSVWITTDIDSNWMQSMTKIAQSKNMFNMSDKMSEDLPQGTIIQMVTKDPKGNISAILTVKEISENESIELKTSEYTFMNFGGQMPAR